MTILFSIKNKILYSIVFCSAFSTIHIHTETNDRQRQKITAQDIKNLLNHEEGIKNINQAFKSSETLLNAITPIIKQILEKGEHLLDHEERMALQEILKKN